MFLFSCVIYHAFHKEFRKFQKLKRDIKVIRIFILKRPLLLNIGIFISSFIFIYLHENIFVDSCSTYRFVFCFFIFFFIFKFFMYFLLTLTFLKEYDFNWLVFYWIVVSQHFLINSFMSNILLLIVRFCQSFFNFYTFPDRYLIILSSLSRKEPPQDLPTIFIYCHLPAFCLLI